MRQMRQDPELGQELMLPLEVFGGYYSNFSNERRPRDLIIAADAAAPENLTIDCLRMLTRGSCLKERN